MKSLDVACRACAAQPGQPCEHWSDLQGGMTRMSDAVHPERIEDAAWLENPEGSPEISEEQFGDALNKTGLI